MIEPAHAETHRQLLRQRLAEIVRFLEDHQGDWTAADSEEFIQLRRARIDVVEEHTTLPGDESTDSQGDRLAIDVTGPGLAEEILRRHAAIVESSDDAIVGADSRGIITIWNKGAERLFGYSAEETIGRSVLFLSPPDSADDGREVLKKVLNGEVLRYHETVRRRKDGSNVDVSLTVSPIVGASGQIVGVSGIARDITVQKRAQAERLLSENRFRQFFETMPEYCYMISPGGEILDVNRAACAALGYRKDELVGSPLSTIYAPECLFRMSELLRKWRTHGEIRNEEMVLITRDGHRRTVLLNVGSVRDSDGNILHSTSVQVDITERKMAEERLRESEEQFRTLAEAIPQLCWMARGDGYIYWYNRRWYGYTGTTSEQMEGWGWQSVHDPRALPDVLERWKSSISTGEPFDMVFPLRGVDGVFRPFLTRVMPIKDSDGRVVRWFGTNTDVTELRNAQEALRESEERLRLAQRAAHIGAFDWNVQTGVNTWTLEQEALYGLPPGSFGKTQAAFEKLIHPDDRAVVVELVERALKTGLPAAGEWRTVWPDGSVHWIAGRWQVFMNESGEAVRIIGVNTDISERKRADELLAGMTRKLIEAQEQERARIARDLHDDINQRLALLSIDVGQLRAYPSEIEARGREVCKRIGEISADVQALAHDLHPSKLEYLGAVAGMKSWSRDFAERQKLELDFTADVRSPLPPEIGVTLFRVLQEALQNIVKHSGAKRVQVQLREDSETLHLVVRDSGRGFDVEAASRGKGLGLTSMRERIRLVNGKIAIDSKPNSGTAIEARVPLDAARNAIDEPLTS
jgi:PAS domain S-box-containing protein